MDFDRLKKLSGLNESDTLGAELNKAKVERTTETAKAPKFKGLLSAGIDDNSQGFSFLKSLKKPIEEAGDDEVDEAGEDRRWLEAKEAFEQDFSIGWVETEAGANDVFPRFLQAMHDGMVDAKEETDSLDKWILAVAGAWESYQDMILNERGGSTYYTEDNGRDHEYDYFEMKLDKDFQKYYAKEFAKWATDHQDAIKDAGFSDFPEVNPIDFSKLVASKLNESLIAEEVDPEMEETVGDKDIETISETLYNKIQGIDANSNILDRGIMVGYVMEQLNIAKTLKNIALVESVIYKK